ncbi:OmpA family protein [uncultured Mucilaginibacter sp.]|uniref:OmpA family protein n=1 Tax=uncultured Mucilaginibacter sp. TaxID=797541 RepID=UPI00342645F9
MVNVSNILTKFEKKITIKLFNLKIMNYSTLKKTVALSFVSLVAAGAAIAQSSSDTSHASTTAAKIFGGRAQYRTWNIGINAGVTSPFLATGGTNGTTDYTANFGYDLTIRKQLAHSFGLQADIMGYGSQVGGTNSTPRAGVSSFTTTIAYAGSLDAVVNVATIDYLRRKNAINFYFTGGLGLVAYNPVLTLANGTTIDNKNKHNGSNTYAKEMFVPVGLGVKFRLSDRVALNFGYTENFVDGDYFDGIKNPATPLHKDKYSYAYGGLEVSLGSSAKPNLDWVNPVAMMYDELNDPTLRQEVQALKGRVSNVEKAVDDLKKDSDGDGVADQFDKCPNTPAGTVVDGSGCPLKIPAPIDTSVFMRKGAVVQGAAVPTAYANIQFEFDSSGLRPTAFPILDATSADLRSSKKTITVAGYASSEGTAAHNLRLSKDRANAVKTYLVNSGVEAKHIKVKGYGETNPVADNSTEAGRELNRRVEFKK